ncbi:dipeptidase [Terricaulis sp.]|uniref:dipeptidase n=1 Tax=Terricaulis sp. TaxID=2768686 RepID=UPI00378397AB
MNRRDFAVGAGALLAAGAVARTAFAQGSAISAAARRVWQRSVVLDCNLGPQISNLPPTEADIALARSSGVSAVKSSIGGFNASFEDTILEISQYQRVIEMCPQAFMQVRTADDILAAKRSHKLGVIFSFESATCLEDKVDRIDLFRNLGVRVMQLSYNLPSPFGAGVMSPPESGLTELGRQAVERMNAQGVALDLSHANPATTAAAIAASTKPVIISHAGCMAIHANPRNKTDEQLRAIAEKGGVVGIYDLFYLAPAGRQPTVEDYLNHMTHALDVCGEDHVGFGSDTSFGPFEITEEGRAQWAAETERRRATGVAAPEEDGRLPYTEGLNRADRALVIADGLMKRGYRAAAVEKVLGANFIRAFREIW